MNLQQPPQGNMSPQMVDNLGMMGHIAMNTSSPPHATSPLHHPSPSNHNMGGYTSPPHQYPQSNLVNIAPRPGMGHEVGFLIELMSNHFVYLQKLLSVTILTN